MTIRVEQKRNFRAPLPVARPRGWCSGPPHSSLRRTQTRYWRTCGVPRRRPEHGTGEARCAGRGSGLPAGPQPDFLRSSPPGRGESRPSAPGHPAGGYAVAEPPGVSPQPLSPPGQALSGRAAQARAPEQPGARRPTRYRALRRPAAGAGARRTRSAGSDRRLALARHGGNQRFGLRHLLLQRARGAAAVRRAGARGGSRAAGRDVLRDPGARDLDRPRIPRLGARVCAGVAVGLRGQLGDAALGATPVPGGGAAGARAARYRLHCSRLWLVPGTARRAQGAHPLVRLRGLPSGAVGQGRATAHAALHRGGRDGRQTCSGDPPHRHRQVALLPDSGPVPLRQDRRAHGGDLAARRAHGRSGGGAGGARHRRLRRHQRIAVPARAGRCARPGQARGRGHPHHLAGAAPQPKLAPGARPARDRRLGAGRSALPVEVGATTSGPTTATWGASSARRRERSRFHRCCA